MMFLKKHIVCSDYKGVDDLCFLPLLLLLAIGMWALELVFGPYSLGLECRPWGWDLGLEAEILAYEVRAWSRASRLELWPRGRDLGLKAAIWISRIGFGPREGGGEEKIPNV